MKIVQINSGNFGSTGSIMRSIAGKAALNGFVSYVCFPKQRSNSCSDNNQILIGGRFSRNIHILLAKITGLTGLFSFISTIRFINVLKGIKPDIIHLHNLHNCYINLQLLFKYIKKNRIKIVWTLHDCWAFTGHCPHFVTYNCSKWKKGCYCCPAYKYYPISLFDNSKIMYSIKKRIFSSVDDMILITPSKWLSNLVEQSFLSRYPVKVINNGIDLKTFKPTKSDFRAKYGISECEYLLLGVAFGWNNRKGLDVFIKLSDILPKKYKICLVGTTDEIDEVLPRNIISVHRTQNKIELAEIYSSADLFVNPTREEVLGLVNIESLACGTPVVTFNTGGSPECIDKSCGSVVEIDDMNSLIKEIRRICEEKPFSRECCKKRAELFNMENRIQDYIHLYKDLFNSN